MPITIQNKQTTIRINKKIINRALKKLSALGGEKIKFFKDYCFSVLLVSDAQIKKLNKTYCKKNHPTDVLSFDTGDIIISTETAKRNAKIYNNTLEKELALYVIHGILHLIGYDDTSKSKAKIMQQKQEEILKTIWQ